MGENIMHIDLIIVGARDGDRGWHLTQKFEEFWSVRGSQAVLWPVRTDISVSWAITLQVIRKDSRHGVKSGKQASDIDNRNCNRIKIYSLDSDSTFSASWGARSRLFVRGVFPDYLAPSHGDDDKCMHWKESNKLQVRLSQSRLELCDVKQYPWKFKEIVVKKKCTRECRRCCSTWSLLERTLHHKSGRTWSLKTVWKSTDLES